MAARNTIHPPGPRSPVSKGTLEGVVLGLAGPREFITLRAPAAAVFAERMKWASADTAQPAAMPDAS